jgi:hypothetical protein
MDREPVVVDESTCEWETWPDEEVAARGLVYWKTLLSADVTPSEALTMGIAKIPPPRRCTNTGTSNPRSTSSSKEPAWSGSMARRGPSERGPRSSIPGNVVHSCENTGASDLRFAYVFPANSFEEVYHDPILCHSVPFL